MVRCRYGTPPWAPTLPPVDRTEPTTFRADVTVVGAGAAGLFAALCAAREGARVALVSRSPLAESASYWAQGGIAAALAIDDSPERHAHDTIAAARGVAKESAVRVLCEDSPDRVRELQQLGVRFDADRHGALALGLEGGHSVRRIVHAGGSATGRRITRQLSAVSATHERIDIFEGTTATALLIDDGRCVGVAARSGDRSLRIASRGTILATGGTAALWSRTTNPPGAVGVGLALAHAAGAELADLEFMQFHPTALRVDGDADGFLITEAVRGEGATLHDANGERFVDELAPRDTVSLAVADELERSGSRAVDLDMRMVDAGRFPNIVEKLRGAGIDPARDLVPVAPAAHYTMGGVATDLDGRASVAGLYAVGECACTGLHGANRLASNSLAECFVLGRRAAVVAMDEALPRDDSPGEPAELPAPPAQSTRDALWRLAGIRRDAAGLRELAEDPFPVARLVAAACLAREESRGAHQRMRLPGHRPEARRRAFGRRRRRCGHASALGVDSDHVDVEQLFHEAMASLASGVAVITARRADDHECGLSATSVVSFSADPPSLLVSIDKSSRCHDALAAAEHFGVHLLHAGQEPLARVFAGKGDDKFGGLEWEWDDDVPQLAHTLAYLRCRRAETFARYDHTILIGDLVGGRHERGEPLLYAQRRMDWLLTPGA